MFIDKNVLQCFWDGILKLSIPLVIPFTFKFFKNVLYRFQYYCLQQPHENMANHFCKFLLIFQQRSKFFHSGKKSLKMFYTWVWSHTSVDVSMFLDAGVNKTKKVMKHAWKVVWLNICYLLCIQVKWTVLSSKNKM